MDSSLQEVPSIPLRNFQAWSPPRVASICIHNLHSQCSIWFQFNSINVSKSETCNIYFIGNNRKCRLVAGLNWLRSYRKHFSQGKRVLEGLSFQLDFYIIYSDLSKKQLVKYQQKCHFHKKHWLKWICSNFQVIIHWNRCEAKCFEKQIRKVHQYSFTSGNFLPTIKLLQKLRKSCNNFQFLPSRSRTISEHQTWNFWGNFNSLGFKKV